MSTKPSARLRSSTRASTAASESWAETKAETKTETKSKGGDSRKATSAPKPMRGSELHRILRIGTAAYLLSLVFMAGVYYVISNDKVKLYPSSIKVETLKGFGSRMEYALRYQSILFFWLVFNIHTVIYARLTHKALNPLVESTEKHVQMQKNILTNSFEGIVCSAFLQLIFVSFADHSCTMKLIPAINLVQFIGRVAFYLGYPYYRTFGVSLTLNPNIALACFNLYKLGSYLDVY